MTQPQDKMRADFEAWCAKDNPRYRHTDDGITSRRDWKIWQAACAQQSAKSQQDALDAARSIGDGYTATMDGKIYSPDGQELQPFFRKNGYNSVSIWRGGSRKEVNVHRIIAEAFCTRLSEEQTQVNHRDGDIKNNHASNLEWCSAKENRVHSARVLFVATRPVVGTNIKTGKEIRFRSLAEAEDNGFVRANIQKCIDGVRNMHGGHTWRDDPIAAIATQGASNV